MLETDFSLLVGLTVALAVFLVVTLSSIRFLRRKGRSPSVYTMSNLSKSHLAGRDMISSETRFGPNRVAADMEGNGEFDFWEIYEDFWQLFEEFWRK